MPMLTLGLLFHGDTGDVIGNFGTFCFVSERCTYSRILLNIEGNRNACLQLYTSKGNNMFVYLLFSKNYDYIYKRNYTTYYDWSVLYSILHVCTDAHARTNFESYCLYDCINFEGIREAYTLRCIAVIRGVFVYFFLCDCVLKTCPESWSKHSSSNFIAFHCSSDIWIQAFPPS